MILKCNKDLGIVEIDLDKLEISEELSYSRLETLMKCPIKYKFKYIEKNYTETTSIALDVGLICHKIMELKYNITEPVSNENLLKYLKEGYYLEDPCVKGVDEIEEVYGFGFYEKNAKTNTNYEDKISIFKQKVLNEELEPEWEVIAIEMPFKILFNNKAVIQGFIDRVDRRTTDGAIRVVDYKTNGKLYDKKDLATPLQMYIYSLAIKEIYGDYPVECIYDMLFLGEKQIGGTKGFLDRGFKKLNSLIDTLAWYKEIGVDHIPPKASPLCYYCDYSKTNNNADAWFSHLCEYHSLWKPDAKSFKTNKDWIAPTDENGWE